MEQWVSEGVVPIQPDAGEPTDEWTWSEARDLADAARQRRYETQQRTSSVAGVGEYAGRAVRQARRTATGYRDDSFEKVTQDIAWYTRERPMTALLIAISVGMMLGWLSAAGRH